jgi:hypothetical protein
MKDILIKFKKLNDNFLSKTISVKQFESRFNKMFYDDKSMEFLNTKQFKVIEQIFWSLEAYEPNKNIRKNCSHCINEITLRKDIRLHQHNLKKLI